MVLPATMSGLSRHLRESLFLLFFSTSLLEVESCCLGANSSSLAPYFRGCVPVRFINAPGRSPGGGKDSQCTDGGDGILTFAEKGEMLLKVAKGVGITIPTSCRIGICGTCTMDLEDPMWEENLSKADQGVEREGYIPFRTCVAKVGVPIGHEEMVIDCWRILSPSNENKNTTKQSHGQHNLALAMKQFDQGWETYYRTISKPVKPELPQKVDRYGNFVAEKKGSIFWTYANTRKRDRQVKAIMRENLDAKAMGAQFTNTQDVGQNPGGADESIKLVTSSKMDDEELSHGNSAYVSDGQGAARLIAYRREGLPVLDERHPLPVTNPRELRRLREKEDEGRENSLSLWPAFNGCRYPSTRYENYEDEWDNEPPVLTQDLELNRVIFRPLVSHPVVDKEGKWIRRVNAQSKSNPKNAVEQMMLEDRSHVRRAEVQRKKPLLELVFGRNVVTEGQKVKKAIKKPISSRLKVAKSEKLAGFIPREEHRAEIGERSKCGGKRAVVECVECSGEGFVMQADEGRIYREECPVCCGAGVTYCKSSPTIKLNKQEVTPAVLA